MSLLPLHLPSPSSDNALPQPILTLHRTSRWGYTHIWGTPTYLSLLVSSQLKVLAPLNRQHPLGPAVGLHALQPQHDFLRGLGLGGEEQWVWVRSAQKQVTATPGDSPLPALL